MLRGLLALLLVANLAFFAWTQGWLDGVVGVRARGDREPERMQRQVHPELVRILNPQTAAAAASPAEARLACLEAGPFDEAGIAAAEAAAATTLPAGAWSRQGVAQVTRWIVYMGRYPNREALQRKEQELSRIHVPYEEVANAADLEPGLALGRFADRDAADAARAQLVQRGVQNARVVELPRERTQYMLRLERADADLAARATALRLDALGRGFVPCNRPS